MGRVVRFLFIFALFMGSAVFAADYSVLVIPDNVASKPYLDSMIYECSSEFFANQIINRLNQSGTIEAPTVSEVRDKLSKNPRLNIATRESLLRFKKEYNINYLNIDKVAQMFNVNKVLLITTAADAQNYFMRRTFWDFLNIPGATTLDPGIKLSTYAVLIDTNRNINLWEDTFYKTISTCETRMIANQLGPQTQQLEKIRDYSRMLAPQIAHNVQAAIVPRSMLCRDNEITYGPKDFDNVFTKKFRWYKHASKEILKETSVKYNDHRESQRMRGIEPLPDKFRRLKKERKERREAKKIEKERIKLLKQEQAREEQNKNIQNINNVKGTEQKNVEIKDIQEPVKPIVIQQEKTNKKGLGVKDEPKVLNVIKEEHLETAPVEVQPMQLKYYQPSKHTKPEIKNTTINDI